MEVKTTSMEAVLNRVANIYINIMVYSVEATVYEPMYEYNDKKYMKITVPNRVRDYILGLHVNRSDTILFPDKLDDPLEGNVLKVSSAD